ARARSVRGGKQRQRGKIAAGIARQYLREFLRLDFLDAARIVAAKVPALEAERETQEEHFANRDVLRLLAERIEARVDLHAAVHRVDPFLLQALLLPLRAAAPARDENDLVHERAGCKACVLARLRGPAGLGGRIQRGIEFR